MAKVKKKLKAVGAKKVTGHPVAAGLLLAVSVVSNHTKTMETIDGFGGKIMNSIIIWAMFNIFQ